MLRMSKKKYMGFHVQPQIVQSNTTSGYALFLSDPLQITFTSFSSVVDPLFKHDQLQCPGKINTLPRR